MHGSEGVDPDVQDDSRTCMWDFSIGKACCGSICIWRQWQPQPCCNVCYTKQQACKIEQHDVALACLAIMHEMIQLHFRPSQASDLCAADAYCSRQVVLSTT